MHAIVPLGWPNQASAEHHDIPHALYYHQVKRSCGGTVTIASAQRALDLSIHEPVAVVSGGYDPAHEGHLACINEAAQYGPVVVICNGDRFLREKRKGEATMPAPLEPLPTRMAKMANLRHVLFVIESTDEDQTVCDTLAQLAAIEGLTVGWFANGGDRKQGTVPEDVVCAARGIEMLWGCGGNVKLGNSSGIVRSAVAHAATNAIGQFQTTRWGGHCNMDATTHTLHKTLIFRPGSGVSLQTHQRRAEEWLCLSGSGWLYLGALDVDNRQLYDAVGMPIFGQRVRLEPAEKHTIVCGQAHMNLNDGTETLIIHETWRHVNPDQQSNEADIAKFGDPFNDAADRYRCRSWLTPAPQLSLVP